MPRKTNKTSHVLNLITNGSAPEQEAAADEKKEEAQQEKKDAVTEAAQGGAPKEAAQGRAPKETVREAAPKETVQSGAPKETAQEAVNPKEPVSRITANGDKTVIVVDETSRNDNISNKILDRLTDQLEEEIQGKLDHYHMVNVMEQILKRMNLKQYLKQYDVCMCSRCQADVMALILTRLPAKYVVVDESSTAPIIGFYESKFKVRILTEIIKACMDVKENPRHDRSGPYDK
ncbi:late competence development ComFB family protein [Enterocloster bolteae]|uniref:late competence development ComFB family protein n=1 Tax=Enterocloster bolteae TaxID=208479 RepID=UPI001D074952|nr:late competence development ComFB family protein [Enterocloster bolteae]MCB6926474.1 late competence development ComFB family protein [Enterocloster bolteae]MCQ4755579.1 late competence development ComFB family protein [Enterocloster bolteae]